MDSNKNNNVGFKIREYRIRKGLTQKELGEKCDIAESTIRRYELGKLNPKIETIKKIAKGLDVSYGELIGEIALNHHQDLLNTIMQYLENDPDFNDIDKIRPLALEGVTYMNAVREAAIKAIIDLLSESLNTLNSDGILKLSECLADIFSREEYKLDKYKNSQPQND